jgi:cytochrome c oxidase assembly protein subunit 15
MATMALILIGGLVTSHGVGLAVPDWPNTYGYNMFAFPISKWVGGIFYEHSHRLMASVVGLLTSILACWLWVSETRGKQRWLGVATILGVLILMGARILPVYVGLASVALITMACAIYRARQEPGVLRWWGIVAFAAVILQGVLGGLRVVWLKDEIGIFHATLAQLFFSLMCALAILSSRWWKERVCTSGPNRTEHRSRNFGRLLSVAVLLLLSQLVLGAMMRHQHAGLAIPDFPLAYGKVWPAMDASSVVVYNQQRLEITGLNPITSFQVGLQMAHRIMALLICITVSLSAWSAFRHFGKRHRLTWLSYSWVGLILIQGLLGAATIWSNKAADIATAHVMIGSLALALGFIIAMVYSRTPVLLLDRVDASVSTRLPAGVSAGVTFR